MLLLIPLILLLTVPGFSSLDPDFGWHLYLGKNLIANHRLITSFIGYTNFQNIYIPDHEWFSDLLLYLIYSKIGYWLLAVLVFLILILTFKFLYSLCLQKQPNKKIAFLSLVPFLLFSSNLLHGIRLQILLVFVSALLLYLHNKILKFKLRLLFYFLIFAIGNNLHGGIFLLSIIPILLESQIFFSSDNVNIKHKISKFSILILVILAALSINPYGLAIWKLAFEYSKDNYYKNHIVEWLPSFMPPIHWFSQLLPFSLVIFTFFITEQYRKIPIPERILLLLFLILGIRFVRFLALFLAISSPYIAVSLANFFQLTRLSERRIKILTASVFACLFIFFASQINLPTLGRQPFDNPAYPKSALIFLSQHPLENNLFNDYGWGGYLLWQRPGKSVFIDGRAPQAQIRPDKTLLMEYNDFFAKDRSEGMLNKYQINTALIKKEEIKHYNILDRLLYKIATGSYPSQVPPPNYLSQYLDNSDAWQKVYEDNLALIYFKND